MKLFLTRTLAVAPGQVPANVRLNFQLNLEGLIDADQFRLICVRYLFEADTVACCRNSLASYFPRSFYVQSHFGRYLLHARLWQSFVHQCGAAGLVTAQVEKRVLGEFR